MEAKFRLGVFRENFPRRTSAGLDPGRRERDGRCEETESESHELEPARRRRRGAGMRRNAGRTDKSHGQHLHKFQLREGGGRGISKDCACLSFI